MPRPVVPIFASPIAPSRAWSSATWYGRTSGQAGEILRRGRTDTPALSSSPISCSSADGDTTTPLPMYTDTPGRRMPDGISRSTVFRPPMTSVCPALWPPWKRTTPCACSVSQSTTLPLPSSPHWVPMTTTFFPMLPSLESRSACRVTRTTLSSARTDHPARNRCHGQSCATSRLTTPASCRKSSVNPVAGRARPNALPTPS